MTITTDYPLHASASCQPCTCLACRPYYTNTNNTTGWTYYIPQPSAPQKDSLPYELAYLAARIFIGIPDPETQRALQQFLEEAASLIDSK
jgi:hypothetical protein